MICVCATEGHLNYLSTCFVDMEHPCFALHMNIDALTLDQTVEDLAGQVLAAIRETFRGLPSFIAGVGCVGMQVAHETVCR